MKVGIIMPSSYPDRVKNGLIPSLDYISELRDIAQFLIVFNGNLWDYSKIDKVLELINEKGFEVKYRVEGVLEKPLNLIKLRTRCAELSPYDKYWLFVDDDFRFVKETPKIKRSSGRRYLEAIDYMDRFDKCGVLNVKSFLGGKPQWLKIIGVDAEMIATNRGLFLRNMQEHGFLLSPGNTHYLVGGLEETLFGYERISRGYFVAKQMNNPTVHISAAGRVSDKGDNMHNTTIMDANIAGYIREKWGTWRYHHKEYPPGLRGMYKINGGIDITDDLIVDYE